VPELVSELAKTFFEIDSLFENRELCLEPCTLLLERALVCLTILPAEHGNASPMASACISPRL
jgi:hypothetical protein